MKTDEHYNAWPKNRPMSLCQPVLAEATGMGEACPGRIRAAELLV